MSDREKLVKILNHLQTCGVNLNGFKHVSNKEIANQLIAHGVTILEKQKPLTVDELIFFNWEIWREWWIELISGRLLCAKECKGYIHIPKVDYGKAWRCWAEKPTEEERRAAKWE